MRWNEPPKHFKEEAALHPPSKVEPVTDVIHGLRIEDPYRWLEDQTSEETQAWCVAQNAHTRHILDGYGLKDVIRHRLSQLRRQPDLSLPVGHAGTLAYSRRDAGQNHSVLYVEKGGRLSVIADPNHDAGPSHVNWVHVSHDGHYVFFGRSRSGNEWATLHVYDTHNDTILDDCAPRTRIASVAAVPGQDGFFYTRYPLADSGLSAQDMFYNVAVYYHHWGTPSNADELIFLPEGDRRAIPQLFLSADANKLVIAVAYGWTRSVLYALDPRDSHQKPRLLVDPGDFFMEPFWSGTDLFATTNWDADTSRVIAIDYQTGAISTRISATPQPILNSAALDGHIAIHRLMDGLSELVLVSAASGVPATHQVIPDFAGLEDLTCANGALFYKISGFGRPAAIHRLEHTEDGWRDDIWAEAGPPDPRVAVTREWATSSDGTRIPVLVAHRRDMVRMGQTPAVLGGYGGFNVPYLPTYSPSVHDWIIRGGIYAQALLRGGREYGESWHRAGMRENKQAVFDDFYAAFCRLIDTGWTNREHLGVTGRSNGGLLTGAFLTQHPNDAAAVVIGVPLLDMLRFHRFLIADLWTGEYGSPENADEFRWLWTYSPYHHVKDGVAYPPVLLFTATEDSRVDPMHARKMAARLQRANVSENPILFRQAELAGHGVGQSNAQWLDDESDIWAFLSHHLGLHGL